MGANDDFHDKQHGREGELSQTGDHIIHKTCDFCRERPSTHAFQPCGCRCVCADCAKELTRESIITNIRFCPNCGGKPWGILAPTRRLMDTAVPPKTDIAATESLPTASFVGLHAVCCIASLVLACFLGFKLCRWWTKP